MPCMLKSAWNFVLVAEYLGEKLAAFFGITTPKYQYVIDEYYRLKQQVSATSLKNPKILSVSLKSWPTNEIEENLWACTVLWFVLMLFKVVPLFESDLVD